MPYTCLQLTHGVGGINITQLSRQWLCAHSSQLISQAPSAMYRMPRVLAASVASNAARSTTNVVTAFAARPRLRPMSHLAKTIKNAETAPSARRNLPLAPRLPSCATAEALTVAARHCSTHKEQTQETVIPDEVIIDGEKAAPEETAPPEDKATMTNDEKAKGSSTTHEVCVFISSGIHTLPKCHS